MGPQSHREDGEGEKEEDQVCHVQAVTRRRFRHRRRRRLRLRLSSLALDSFQLLFSFGYFLSKWFPFIFLFDATEFLLFFPKGWWILSALYRSWKYSAVKKESEGISLSRFSFQEIQNLTGRYCSRDGRYWVSKKSVLWQFSALSRLSTMDIFFITKIIDKVLSLSKFWRHLANVKIVKIRHLNGYISYIKQY